MSSKMTFFVDPDYVCVQTWNPVFQRMQYHWVHKSEKDPVQFVKNLNPEQEVL